MEKARVENPERPSLHRPPVAITVDPCFCTSGELSEWIRGRAHYHCGENSCPFVTDRETRLRKHRIAHNGMNADPDPCFCATNGTRCRDKDAIHYHCDVCYRSFQRPWRVKQHAAATHMAQASKQHNAFGAPRIGNPFGRYAKRLQKTNIVPELPSAMSDKVRKTMQIGPRELPRPDACGESNWRTAFSVVELGSARVGCRDSSIFLVHNVFPRVWICSKPNRLELRGE